MVTEDYVSFETAKLLKEKGFNENTGCQYPVCGIHYGEVGEYNITDRSRNPECYIQAPTLQMAMKWLREVHNMFIRIIQSHIEYCTYEVYYDRAKHYESRESYNSYEEACEAAIKYCLENLI